MKNTEPQDIRIKQHKIAGSESGHRIPEIPAEDIDHILEELITTPFKIPGK